MVAGAISKMGSVSDRVLEIAAAVLLGLATFGSAWCAFEAARWNDDSTLNQSTRNAWTDALSNEMSYIASRGLGGKDELIAALESLDRLHQPHARALAITTGEGSVLHQRGIPSKSSYFCSCSTGQRAPRAR